MAQGRRLAHPARRPPARHRPRKAGPRAARRRRAGAVEQVHGQGRPASVRALPRSAEDQSLRSAGMFQPGTVIRLSRARQAVREDQWSPVKRELQRQSQRPAWVDRVHETGRTRGGSRAARSRQGFRRHRPQRVRSAGTARPVRGRRQRQGAPVLPVLEPEGGAHQGPGHRVLARPKPFRSAPIYH